MHLVQLVGKANNPSENVFDKENNLFLEPSNNKIILHMLAKWWDCTLRLWKLKLNLILHFLAATDENVETKFSVDDAQM